MPDFPLTGLSVHEALGRTAGSSQGIRLTAGTPAHTKAAYATLIAATARPISLLHVWMGRTVDSTAEDFLVDIAVGAAASEVVILSDLLYSDGGATGESAFVYQFPIPIPAGTRISARAQCSTASTGITVCATGFSGGMSSPIPFGQVVTYGANTADSGGTQVDCGASASTKGAWSELSASTSADHRGLVMALGGQLNTVRTTGHMLVDIGVGAAASEVVVVPDFWFVQHAQLDFFHPAGTPYLPVDIPAGSRLAVRAQSQVNDATDRLFDVVLYGVS